MRFRRRYEVVVQGESGSAVSQLSVISEHRSERDAREAAALERRRLEVIRAEEAASWVIMVMRGDEVLHEERPFDGHRENAPVPVGPGGITPTDPVSEAEAAEGAEPAPPPADAGDGEQTSPDSALGGEEEQARSGAAQTGTIPAVAAAPAAPEAGANVEPAVEEPADEPAPSQPPASAHDAAQPAHAAFAVPDDIVAPAGDDPVPAFLAEPSPAPAAAESAGSEATGQAARPRRDSDIPSGPVPDDVIRRFEEAIAREKVRERERGGRRS